MDRPPSSLLNSSWKIIPHFPSSSIPASITFYTQTLHFTLGGVHPDDGPAGAEPTMCSLYIGRKAEANIYLFQQPRGPQGRVPITQPSAASIALGTHQLDAYYALLKREGKVEFSMEIEDVPWGYRQFEVKDGDGNRIQFFRFLEGGNPGTEDGGDASLALWESEGDGAGER